MRSQTSDGEIPADMVVIGTQEAAQRPTWPRQAGIKLGSTGGIIVDEHMATSAAGVFAAGDCVEVPQGDDRGAGPGPVRQPRLRAGQGRRQRRGRQAAHLLSRSTCRGAWSAASG